MSDAPTILIVDDDRDIRQLLTKLLKEDGYRVHAVGDGREMAQALRSFRCDLVVLDLMLPGEDGLTLCRRLRAESDIPIIMLTARGDDVDRIVGLEVGADDYLPKPFNPRELTARIKSVLRRAQAAPPHPADVAPGEMRLFAGWRLDLGARRLFDTAGALVHLTSGEFDLLRALTDRPGRLLSRDQLTRILHGPNPDSLSRAVDVHMSRLRRKIETDAAAPQLIVTVRNEGYLLNAVVEREHAAGDDAP